MYIGKRLGRWIERLICIIYTFSSCNCTTYFYSDMVYSVSNILIFYNIAVIKARKTKLYNTKNNLLIVFILFQHFPHLMSITVMMWVTYISFSSLSFWIFQTFSPFDIIQIYVPFVHVSFPVPLVFPRPVRYIWCDRLKNE